MMRLGIFQFAPALRDVAGNSRRIAEAAAAARTDLFITPELSLTGYDLRDDVHTIACEGEDEGMGKGEEKGEGEGEVAVLVGTVERDAAGVPYNVAQFRRNGDVLHTHRKVYLPTYGMFDEGRYFGKGRQVVPFEFNGWRIGVLICEDFWHPMLAYLHALQGIDLLVVMAAAPGRGAWSGGEDGGFFASSDSWQRIARAYAQLYGIYVVVCNRTGVEGGITFAGESFAVAPDSRVIARAGIEEELLPVEIDKSLVQRTRIPYAHIRDENAYLAMAELQRITTSS